MPTRRTRALTVLPMLLLVATATGCPHDDDTAPPLGSATATDSTTGPDHGDATGPAMIPGPGLDSTGAWQDPCIDDYDGHHDLASPFALGLDTNDTTRAILGDELLLGVGNEQGSDRLVVCPSSPDFFSVQLACAGYLGVDVRRLGDGGIDLHVYADGIELDHASGTWHGFHLKPLHLPALAQSYTLEVRHTDGDAQAYSLDLYVLPTAPCS